VATVASAKATRRSGVKRARAVPTDSCKVAWAMHRSLAGVARRVETGRVDEVGRGKAQPFGRRANDEAISYQNRHDLLVPGEVIDSLDGDLGPDTVGIA